MFKNNKDKAAIFEELKRTDAYTNSAPERTKREIFCSFWKECAVSFKGQFGLNGISVVDENDRGFGYLVEEFAKRSHALAKNSPAAANLERLFLHALQTGDRLFVGIGRLKNPDIIRINCRGKKAEISGMGEVKASSIAVQNSREQLEIQESSIRKLIDKINEEKKNGTVNQCFVRWTFSVSEEFRKILIVPLGQMPKLQDVPDGWQVQELEFSYQELVFIARKLWPEFQSNVQISEGFLGRYEQQFLEKLILWGKERLSGIFQDNPKVVSEALFFFSFATGKLPLDDSEISWAKELAKCADPSVFRNFNQSSFGQEELGAGEREFLEKFLILFGSESREFVFFFLARNRIFARQIIKQARKTKETGKIQQMENINFLTL